MAFSVESRVPFLDHRLVEFAFRLRTEDKVRGAETKHILREALAGILPEAIRRRTDKKGFVTPGENKWLRGPLKHLLKKPLDDLGLLNRKKCEALLAAYRKGDNRHAALVWRLAVLNYWAGEIK
jgi:asparagine synthase (glutamine-hydrolysing)